MLSHKNDYVRGIGFLYLRYLLPPNKIWDWFKGYLEDVKYFIPGGDGKEKSKWEDL